MFQIILSAFCLWETAVDFELGRVSVCISAYFITVLLLIQSILPLVRRSFAREAPVDFSVFCANLAGIFVHFFIAAFRLISKPYILLIQLMLPLVRRSFARGRH